MLSISTGKHQSTEASAALYISIYEYSFKVITRCDTILQEYYITDRLNCENTKRCTRQRRSRVTEGKLERRAGGLEGYGFRKSADDPHYRYATLINNRENSQAPSF